MTHLKVSGVVRPDDAASAASLGVDFVACMFYAGSPRYVTIEQAWDIRRAVGSSARVVGVFVDTPTPIVQRVVDHCRLDMAQLFGSEARSAVETLRPHAFKALTIATLDDADQALRAHPPRRSASSAEPALLLHLAEGTPDSWSIVPTAVRRAPVIIADPHLTPERVSSIVPTVAPWGLDVWSAVEARPGELDRARLEELVTALREADRHAATCGELDHR